MDGAHQFWYLSSMATPPTIPVFTLFGETDPFPDVVHKEEFSARAPIHEWRISAHRHSQMAQLFLIERGSVRAKVEGTEVTLFDCGYLFVPAQSVHEFWFQPGTEGNVFSFPAAVVNSVGPSAPALTAALSQPITGASVSAEMRALVTALGSALDVHSPFRSQIAVGLAHAVLGALAQIAVQSARDTDAKGAAAAPQTPFAARLSALDSLIVQHMGDGWRASEYARALSLSTGHLSRLCRAGAGMGATAYIEVKVMQEACRLLAFTQLPTAEVGYRLGFADPSYFSRRFRAVRGQSPTGYRAQFAG